MDERGKKGAEVGTERGWIGVLLEEADDAENANCTVSVLTLD